MHLGDNNVNAGVRPFRGDEAFKTMLGEIDKAFSSADFPEVIRLMDKHFGESNYSLRSLFRDEQHKVLNRILQNSLTEADASYRQIYRAQYPLMRFLISLGNPLPVAFKSAAEISVNGELREALAADDLDADLVARLLEDAQLWNINLDKEGLGLEFRQNLERKMLKLTENPEDIQLIDRIISQVEMTKSLPFSIELREVQNVYYNLFRSAYPAILERTAAKAAVSDVQYYDDKGKCLYNNHVKEENTNWSPKFLLLGEKLSIRVK